MYDSPAVKQIELKLVQKNINRGGSERDSAALQV